MMRSARLKHTHAEYATERFETLRGIVFYGDKINQIVAK
jgi:hypothetical protein